MKKMTMSEVMNVLVINHLDEKVEWVLYDRNNLALLCKECGETIVSFHGNECEWSDVYEHECFLEVAWKEDCSQNCMHVCLETDCSCRDLAMFEFFKHCAAEEKACGQDDQAELSDKKANELLEMAKEAVMYRDFLSGFDWETKKDGRGYDTLYAIDSLDGKVALTFNMYRLHINKSLIVFSDVIPMCIVARNNVHDEYVSSKILELRNAIENGIVKRERVGQIV